MTPPLPTTQLVIPPPPRQPAYALLACVAVVAAAALIGWSTRQPPPLPPVYAAPTSGPLPTQPPATPSGPLVIVVATNTPTPYATPRPTKAPPATLPACPVEGGRVCEWRLTPTPGPTVVATQLPVCGEPIEGVRCRWPTAPIPTSTARIEPTETRGGPH